MHLRTKHLMGLSDEGELSSDSFAGTKLLMCQNRDHKDRFQIYNLGYELRYRTKKTAISKAINITDSNGVKLVSIKRKRFAFRTPWSMQLEPIDFRVWIDGKGAGIIKTHYKGMKRIVKTSFNDWTIKGNFWGTKYQIVSGDALIATITETTERSETHYVVSCIQKNDLLTVLTLMLIAQETK